MTDLPPEDAPTVGQTVALVRQSPNLLPKPLAELQEAANLLARAGPMVPPMFQNEPDRCLAIVYQAARWGMDPVAVASQAYFTPDKSGAMRINYQAQLVAALVYNRAPIQGRPKISFHGEGANRYCHVSIKLRGTKERLDYTSPKIAQIKVKNSPLWFVDPDQQLSYYSIRAWARRWTPDILMGVYTPDDFQEVSVQDVSEIKPKRDPFDEEEPPHVEAELVVDGDGVVIEEPPEPSGGHQQEPEPPERKAEREWFNGFLAKALELESAEAVQDAWNKLLEAKNAGRVKSYQPEVITAGRAAVAARVAELAEQKPADDASDFPGDR